MFEKKHFTEIPSTHKWALAQKNLAQMAPLLVTSDLQSDSVGRRPGTSWLSPPNTALLATFIIPNFQSKQTHNLAQLMTCSIATILEPLSIFPSYKWPNDLTLSNKKLAGAMADIHDGAAIVSCGMNINTSDKDLALVDIPATSLLSETKRKYDIHDITDSLAKQFWQDLDKLQATGFSSYVEKMNASLLHKGKLVKITDGTIDSGIVKEITSDGRLAVEIGDKITLLSNGSLHTNY